MKTIFCLLFILFSVPSYSCECFTVNEIVTLTGTITRETFPGRPNYESIDNGDEPETYWILTIEKPRIVLADIEDSDEIYAIQKKASRFQLVFNDAKIYEKFSNLPESKIKVVVTGEIFAAETGHHHTKVLIQVNQMKKQSK